MAAAKKASPFSASNRDAAFNPQKAEFSVGSDAEFVVKKGGRPGGSINKGKGLSAGKKVVVLPNRKKPVTNYPNSSTSRTRPVTHPVPPKKQPAPKPVPPKKSTANGGSGSMGGVAVQVVKGDTLWAIAKRAIQRTGQTPTNAKINSSLAALIRAHPEYQKNPNLIKPGQVVRW